MDEKQLLEAMRDIVKTEIQASNESLRHEMNRIMDEKFVAQDKRTDEKFDAVYEQLAEIREDTAITRTAINILVDCAYYVTIIPRNNSKIYCRG